MCISRMTTLCRFLPVILQMPCAKDAKPDLEKIVLQGSGALPKCCASSLPKIQEFLQQPYASEARTWRAVFARPPPRAVVQACLRSLTTGRGAPKGTQTKLEANRLHETMQRWNYRSKKEFRTEARRILRWWSQPVRRAPVFRKRIFRDGQKRYWARPSTVVTKKARGHFKKMTKKLRIEGFFKWQQAALGTLEAQIPVQSGTIPVERFWSTLLTYVPESAQYISLKWYQVLASLAFIKFNFQHFARTSLAGVSEEDADIQSKIDTAMMLARALHESETVWTATHLQPVFDPFRESCT